MDDRFAQQQQQQQQCNSLDARNEGQREEKGVGSRTLDGRSAQQQ